MPILTKADIRDHGPELLSTGYDKKDLWRKTTSGSTGVSLEIWWTSRPCSSSAVAPCGPTSGAAGGSGERVAMVWGNPEYLQARLAGAGSATGCSSAARYLDTLKMDERPYRCSPRDLTRRPPPLIFGHAHSVYLFAEFVLERRVSGRSGPKASSPGAMLLHDWQRTAIEEAFACKVTNRYGCEEVSLIACECERHEGLHVNADGVYVGADPGRRPRRAGRARLGRRHRPDQPGHAAHPLPGRRRGVVGRPAVPVRAGHAAARADRGREADYVTTPWARADLGDLADRELRPAGARAVAQLQIVQEELDRFAFRIVRGRRLRPGQPGRRSIGSCRTVRGRDAIRVRVRGSDLRRSRRASTASASPRCETPSPGLLVRGTNMSVSATISIRQPPEQRGATCRIPDSPLFSVEASNPSTGMEAYVCIHSMGRYGASGGMRCLPDISPGEVQILARAMSFKYSFFQIEQGGAKAGLRISYEEAPERRRALIREAARHLEPLIKKYVWSPWSDMNFYGDDLASFFDAIGMSFHQPSGGGSSFRTAVSAAAALKASTEYLDIEPHRLRVAMEGFGSVATHLVPFSKRWGVRLVAVSTHVGGLSNSDGLDLDACVEMRRKGPSAWHDLGGTARRIDRDELFDLETDILIPTHRVHSIDASRASRIKARLLLPIGTRHVREMPCRSSTLETYSMFPTTWSTVVASAATSWVMPRADAPSGCAGFVEVFRAMVVRMLRMSEATKIPPRELADRVAHRNYPAIAANAYDQPSRTARLMEKLRRLPPLAPRSWAQAEVRARMDRTLKHLNNLFISET